VVERCVRQARLTPRLAPSRDAGQRRGEVLGLRWSEINVPRRTARLTDTKTDASLRALSLEACTVIQAQARNGDLVFPGRSGGPTVGYPKMWLRIAKLGDQPAEITPHVLRHSFASLAADLGYGESTIAALVGHKLHSITSRYVHSADAVLLAAADAVENAIVKLMKQSDPEPTSDHEPHADHLGAGSVASDRSYAGTNTQAMRVCCVSAVSPKLRFWTPVASPDAADTLVAEDDRHAPGKLSGSLLSRLTTLTTLACTVVSPVRVRFAVASVGMLCLILRSGMLCPEHVSRDSADKERQPVVRAGTNYYTNTEGQSLQKCFPRECDTYQLEELLYRL